MNITWIGGIVLLFLLISCVIGYRRGFIKEIVSMFFLVFAFTVVWFANPYIDNFLRENTSAYQTIYRKCDQLVDKVSDESGIRSNSEQLIDKLPVPEIIKKNILKNNTSDVYQRLSADSFREYIVRYLSDMFMKGISFIISFTLATILIRALAYLLDIIAKLPVLNGINRIIGALLGTTKALIVVWIIMLILTLLCNTRLGAQAMEYVRKDTILSVLYDNNILVRIFMSILNAVKH